MIKKYFGDKAFFKSMFTLAIPIALQNLLAASYTLVDTLMVGNLGDVTLSAVGMAAQCGLVMNMMFFGICSGASVFFAQYYGAKDKKGISRTYGISLILILAVSLAFSLLFFFCPVGVIRIFNKDAAVVAEGSKYLKILSWSYPAVGVNLLFSTILRCTEKVRLPMIATLITTLVNTVLDYSMIYGKFGFAPMGVSGAALATVIASWTAPVLVLIISFVTKNIVISPLKDMFGFTKKQFVAFLKTAMPTTANETLWGLGTLVFAIIYSNMSYEQYAAVTILNTFSNMFLVFIVGMCNASCVMIGKNVGCGNIEQAVSDARRFAVLVPLTSMLLGAAILIFRRELIWLFDMNGKLSELTYNTAMGVLAIYAIEIPIRNIPYIQIVGIFRAGGNTADAAKADLLCLWGIAVPLTIVCAYVIKLPFLAVYALMYVFEDWPKSVICIRKFKKLKWLKPVTAEGKEAFEKFKAEQI